MNRYSKLDELSKKAKPLGEPNDEQSAINNEFFLLACELVPKLIDDFKQLCFEYGLSFDEVIDMLGKE